ncbi:3-hydroxyacyl-CoA dehydrogenase family protein [Streptomyces armeniacus]|uniref:3-hydroxyacyl-CoA dehydrogenase family protein n=1 Tax=Streptomyces armeniacus TaxID=83291 RepID=UPI001FE8FC7E|nr:3-hydroxyacyl-CoA dehydrogenase family protein [Streptomyces armeniacus]
MIGVVGAGTMGVGVAQSFATAGHHVVLLDPSVEAAAAGRRLLRNGLRAARLLRKPASPEPMDDIAARIDWTHEVNRLAQAECVVECGPESIAVKKEILTGLDGACAARTVLASCTSAIPVSTLAGFTGRPDRVLATHFMNPAPLKDAVEVVRGPQTSAETLETVQELLRGLGKRPHVVNDGPGFVSNRVLMPMVNDAAERVQSGTADAETVDLIFTDCFGHAMGPLRTADLIGLDTVLDTLVVLRETTGDSRYEPCELLRELVEAGHHGRKSGRGFHSYGAR